MSPPDPESRRAGRRQRGTARTSSARTPARPSTRARGRGRGSSTRTARCTGTSSPASPSTRSATGTRGSSGRCGRRRRASCTSRTSSTTRRRALLAEQPRDASPGSPARLLLQQRHRGERRRRSSSRALGRAPRAGRACVAPRRRVFHGRTFGALSDRPGTRRTASRSQPLVPGVDLRARQRRARRSRRLVTPTSRDHPRADPGRGRRSSRSSPEFLARCARAATDAGALAHLRRDPVRPGPHRPPLRVPAATACARHGARSPSRSAAACRSARFSSSRDGRRCVDAGHARHDVRRRTRSPAGSASSVLDGSRTAGSCEGADDSGDWFGRNREALRSAPAVRSRRPRARPDVADRARPRTARAVVLRAPRSGVSSSGPPRDERCSASCRRTSSRRRALVDEIRSTAPRSDPTAEALVEQSRNSARSRRSRSPTPAGSTPPSSCRGSRRTTAARSWLLRRDVGQGEELDGLEEKARETGACEVHRRGPARRVRRATSSSRRCAPGAIYEGSTCSAPRSRAR